MQTQGRLPLLERFLSGGSSPSSSLFRLIPSPTGRRDAPEEVTQEDIEDDELIADEAMQSARSST